MHINFEEDNNTLARIHRHASYPRSTHSIKTSAICIVKLPFTRNWISKLRPEICRMF